MIRGQERALASLLGTKKVPAAGEYPDKLVLPSYIQEKTAEAIGQTVTDGLEKFIDFRYRRRKWTGDIGQRSTGWIINDKRAWQDSTPSSLAYALHRPDVFLHTHPTPSTEVIREFVLATERGEALSESDLEETIEFTETFNKVSMMFPSNGDVKAFAFRSAGKVANIVASQRGNFLLVKKNLRARNPKDGENLSLGGNPFNQKARLESLKRAGEIMRDLDAEIETSVETDHDLIKLTLDGIDRAIGYKYALYFSDDPETPHLSRVH